ncbi:site-2 protease family protein [Patescibacteria group bacterium]|nr:site-2 protease family protein [Patescibacteria group bacterium]MBU4274899.1 site-2 protease family protein [Patescibacteria group bacterium]MBU4367919.1 site-2 protease family protein [Patescibacteria group bacterium]MBU4461904.1 site-2 protease family protein [Patescibacteria group bacterium]MCG2699847.1 site-2 protease family protein [Candidatus Parcubacteria bacterium]
MILAIIIAFFSVIFLMIIHEFGHFIAAKKSGLNVEEFGIGYPPRICGKKIGKTLYSLNLFPFGAFVKIPGEIGGIEDRHSFSGLSMPKKVFIVLGGIISFWVAAIIIFTVVFNIGVEIPISDEDDPLLTGAKIQVLNVHQDSPAEISGIKRGDIIKELWVEGSDKIIASRINDFQDFIEVNKGKKVYFIIQRGNQSLNISLVPRVSPPQNEGLIGVQLQRTATLIEKYPWYQTPIKGLVYCGEISVKAIGGLVGILSDLITGKGVPAGAEPAGPIGITVYLARAAELGIGFFLYFIGAISVLLAIFNLLPIPALDGGKLLFLAIEKIKGKSISPKIEQTITVIFFFMLITLSIFVTIKFDIPKFSEFIIGH